MGAPYLPLKKKKKLVYSNLAVSCAVVYNKAGKMKKRHVDPVTCILYNRRRLGVNGKKNLSA